jgi:hypothetical protein
MGCRFAVIIDSLPPSSRSGALSGVFPTSTPRTKTRAFCTFETIVTTAIFAASSTRNASSSGTRAMPAGGPSARYGLEPVWTGSYVILAGGTGTSKEILGDGAIFVP